MQPGHPSTVTVKLTAGGNETLQNVRLSLQLPQGWTARSVGRSTFRFVALGQAHAQALTSGYHLAFLIAAGLIAAAIVVAAVVVQSPNVFGALDALPPAVAQHIKATGTVVIGVVAEALSLAALATPASWGADICVGEAQSFGNAIAYGGPHVGFIAATAEHLRRIPGRHKGSSYKLGEGPSEASNAFANESCDGGRIAQDRVSDLDLRPDFVRCDRSPEIAPNLFLSPDGSFQLSVDFIELWILKLQTGLIAA